MARKTASTIRRNKKKSRTSVVTLNDKSLTKNNQGTKDNNTSILHQNKEDSHCNDIECNCFLKRGQMFLPPNLLNNGDDGSNDQDVADGKR